MQGNAGGGKDDQNLFQIPGREGMYKEAEKVHDKYACRPEGIEELTLSQFATSYKKCRKEPKNLQFNDFGVTEEKGNIIDHITEQYLPQHIKMTTGEIFYLRRFSTVLRIHSSSKKEGLEEYFAEMQLFSPWRSAKLEDWRDPDKCVEEFQERQETIYKVRSKTFPFSMHNLIEEMRTHEATLNQGKT